jgi:hypothetical protein
MNRIKKLFMSSASWWLAISCCAPFSGACQEQHRRPSLYLVPEGYVGWVRIDFGVEGAPPLLLEDGHYFFKFPPTGIIQTSSALEEGYAEDKYYYYSDSGGARQPLHGSVSGGGGMIWGEVVSRVQDGKELHEYFFVGTEADFKDYGLKEKAKDGNPMVGPITRSQKTIIESN